ncbi:hypothetical protein RND71_036920 [Anisodus tanguticus]|uniref:Uncharacterized protein n=1 Tax=Anisodus tanguticus TaxID=243964 RepID=A0AAE1UYC4_9SOLA|nr:hypothetical protein RND71_036920 [Anisodus tanguticus]
MLLRDQKGKLVPRQKDLVRRVEAFPQDIGFLLLSFLTIKQVAFTPLFPYSQESCFAPFLPYNQASGLEILRVTFSLTTRHGN